MKSTALACVALVSIAGAAQAQPVLFDSAGWEAPGYTLGELVGQAGFVCKPRDPASPFGLPGPISTDPALLAKASVYTGAVFAGTQGVRLDGGSGSNYYNVTLPSYTPAPGDIVVVRTQLARTVVSTEVNPGEPPAITGSANFSFNAFDSRGLRISRMGITLVNSTIGMRPIISMYDPSVGAGTQLTYYISDADPNGTFYTNFENEFVEFEMQLNFTTQTFRWGYKGFLIGFGIPAPDAPQPYGPQGLDFPFFCFPEGPATGIAELSLQGSSSVNSNLTDSGFFDNTVVFVVPAPTPPCLADVSGDGVVDGSDFTAFINSFGVGDPAVDPIADVNLDGVIDGNDFVAFINAFAAGC